MSTHSGTLPAVEGIEGTMHIILGALAVIGTIVFFLIRTRNAANTARDLIGVADDMRAAVRRFGYSRKANQNPLDELDDPRLAAAGVLAAFARMDGSYTAAQISAIEAECANVFQASESDAAQITAYGRWLAQQSENMDEVVRRLAKSLNRLLDTIEKQQVLAMATRVASVEGSGPSDVQAYALETLKRQLA